MAVRGPQFATALMAFFGHLPLLAQNQEDKVLELLEQRLNQNEDLDYAAAYENLFNLLHDPININEANAYELRKLAILSEYKIEKILEYVNTVGPLISVYELQAIPNLELSDIYNLLPFISVKEAALRDGSLWQRLFSDNQSYLMINHKRTLEEKAGFKEVNDDKAFIGGADKLQARFRLRHSGDFSIGLTLEKDPGEKLADFFSAHIALYNRGKLRTLIVGDYQAQFGQGLIAGSGFNQGKGSETIATIKRHGTALKPYTSVNELKMLRGIGTTLSAGPLSISTLFSIKPMDGNVKFDSIASTAVVTSLPQAGLHRNKSELGRRHSLTEIIAGGNIHFAGDGGLAAGINILKIEYSLPLRSGSSLYQIHDFTGKSALNGSTYFNYIWRNLNFFSEYARSQEGGTGWITGLIAVIDPKVDLAAAYRSYNPKFYSPYSSAFGERSKTSNEEGLYWGVKIKPTRKIGINAFFDSYKFPWLSFGHDKPLSGQEWMVMTTYKPTRQFDFWVQFRKRNREELPNSNSDVSLRERKRGVKFSARYQVHERISLQTRVLHSKVVSTHRSAGIALAQDIELLLGKFSVNARYAGFDTDNFDNRQYLFERDMLYSFSIPAHQGLGTRVYVLFKLKLSKTIALRLKWAQFKYFDRDTVGSGLEAISGNTRTEVKSQLRIRI